MFFGTLRTKCSAGRRGAKLIFEKYERSTTDRSVPTTSVRRGTPLSLSTHMRLIGRVDWSSGISSITTALRPPMFTSSCSTRTA